MKKTSVKKKKKKKKAIILRNVNIRYKQNINV